VSRTSHWLVAHGRWVVGVVVAMSVALGLLAAGTRFAFRYPDLLPQAHPFISVHNRYHRNFSEANVLTVMIEAREGTIFTAPILRTRYALTDAVEALPGVNNDQVDSLAHRSTRWVRARAGGLLEGGPVRGRP
jgi:predicted RND superfamily exporter protein